MKADAAAHEADDKKRAEVVEARNIADQAVYAAEKAVRENGEKVSADTVKEVQEKIETVKTAQKGDDAAAIKSATEALSTSLSKIGEEMMKAQQNQTPPSGGDAAGPDQGGGAAGATDAEFKEKPE